MMVILAIGSALTIVIVPVLHGFITDLMQHEHREPLVH